MKKIIILLVSGFVFCFFASVFSCNQCGYTTFIRKVVDMNWSHQKAVYTDSLLYNVDLSEIENDSVYYEHFSIIISPVQIEYTADASFDHNWNFNMFQTLHACDPQAVTDERIDDIIITSSSDYDAEHPAGTDLADLFDMVYFYRKNIGVSLKFSLEEYLDSSPMVTEYEWMLFLNKQPDMPGFFDFNIKYFQSGRETNASFEYNTGEIYLKDVE